MVTYLEVRPTWRRVSNIGVPGRSILSVGVSAPLVWLADEIETDEVRVGDDILLTDHRQKMWRYGLLLVGSITESIGRKFYLDIGGGIGGALRRVRYTDVTDQWLAPIVYRPRDEDEERTNYNDFAESNGGSATDFNDLVPIFELSLRIGYRL